ncbi:guanylate kinase [Roseomonas sp. OT10]|uniref:guanylate kinase n=1 Tax=Roseomonas cutis TaxID=2897332 RepID=UPI001E3089A2|nr:guanylate kinase [Roseomonas sp. OT10]UFN47649.1 guanylate kinase [Roseomonas sp. OT10]
MSDPGPEAPIRRLRRGLCLALVAPSGAGKSSVSRAVLAQEPEMTLSISVTTRSPRPGEVDGMHYHFIDDIRFEQLVRDGALLESAGVYGRRYGSPRGPVLEALAAGRDVMFDVDWQGHRQLRDRLPGDVVGIFLLPPNLTELERRLRARGQDSDAEIGKRLAAAREDLSHWFDFGHVLVNEVFEETVSTVRGILAAERNRRERNPWLPRFVDALAAEAPPGPGPGTPVAGRSPAEGPPAGG